MYINDKQKWIVFIAIGLMLLSLSYWSHRRGQENIYQLSGKDKEIPVEWNRVEEDEKNLIDDGVIVVHIEGAVQSPGVYELKEGARVLDAVEAAGGFTENADRQQINLALKIYDEDFIKVPIQGESTTTTPIGNTVTTSPNSNVNRGKININNAGINELTQLTGIGNALAERIVEYRQQNGPFRSIDELKRVSGIGDKKFEQIKNDIIVR